MMRIVDLKTFRALPSGTLFSKYEPCVFDRLSIKGPTWEHDFLVQGIESAIDCTGSGDFSNKLDDATNRGASLSMDFDCMGRDGCFEDKQLFAVWEADDHKALIQRLQEAYLQAFPNAGPRTEVTG